MNKKVLIVLLLTFVFISHSAISKGYSFFDTKSDTANETLTIGVWDFVVLLIGPDFASDLYIYIENEIIQNPDTNSKYIYSQTDVPNKITATIPSIDVFGYTWDFKGKGRTNNYPTMGYPVLVDRALDESGNPVHDIAPVYSSTDLYPEYNYFTVYDAMNLHTNNQYSIRLNYYTTMQTSTAVGQVSDISFYAMAGLSDTDDAENIRDGKFYVYVSTNGSKWTRIGSERSIIADSDNEFFTHYSFDVPGSMLGEELFVKIAFVGQTYRAGFSRLIIDELVINTIN